MHIGEESTQILDNATLSAEAKYLINFTQRNKRSALSIHGNGSNSFLFVNATEIYKFKGKDSEIKDYTLRLGHVNNMKKKMDEKEL